MKDLECEYYEIYLTINETKAIMRYHFQYQYLIHKLVLIHKKF